MKNSEIRENIHKLAIPSNVTLLAVSKTKSVELIQEAYDVGQRHFGENYIQEAVEKIQALKSVKEIKWHFIGHLQSNKVNIAAQYFDIIHTIDSLKLANKLNQACKELDKKMPIFIQINIGEESQKSGIKIEEIESLLNKIFRLDFLLIKGFMCVPPFDENPEPFFKKMQDIFLKYKEQYNLTDLSMGMSSDYQEAIKYGSTIVRIGTKIFGERSYPK